MQTKQLGITDIQVSKICLGTMTRGYQNTESEAHEQLDYAVAHGINFIDTAELYAVPPSKELFGLTETYIGNWLTTQDRSTLILASKIAGPEREYIRNGEGFTPHGIVEAIEGSLKRLQTEYIDLYQLHWPQRNVQLRGKMNYHESMFDETGNDEAYIHEILKTCKTLVDAGKIRYIGLSNETPRGMMKFVELAEKYNLPRIVANQNAYNLIRRDYEIGCAEVSIQSKVGLLAYSPLAGGLLSGKYQGGALPAGARYSTRGKDRMPYYTQQKSLEAIDQYVALAHEIGITPAQLALAWVNDRGFVTSNIIGATTMDQLKECISSADITLSPEVYTKIDALHALIPNPACF